MTCPEPTHEEAIQTVVSGVRALFRNVRNAEPHEQCAYLTKRAGADVAHRYVFVTFINGTVRSVGALDRCCVSLNEAAECSVLNLGLTFPNHANEDLV